MNDKESIRKKRICKVEKDAHIIKGLTAVNAQSEEGAVRLNLMQCGDGPDHGREEAAAANSLLS